MAYYLKDKEETHPAYGLLSFHRVTGDPGPLFGSHLDHHHGYIEMHLAKGELIRDGNEDRYYGNTRGDVVSVKMSAAQFAELVTTLNMGLGTPVTITSVKGEVVEKIPADKKTEQQNIRESFEEEMYAKTKDLRAAEARIDEILNKKGTLTKKDKEAIRSLYKNLLRHFEANAGFAVRMFSESVEKVIVEAKANVDNFVTTSLTAMGLDALKKKFTSNSVLKSLTGETTTPKNSMIDMLPEATDAE